MRRWIAKQVGVSENTLRLHYEDELNDGDTDDEEDAFAKVRLIANDPNHPRQLAALIFILNTRYGHATREKTELEGKFETKSLPVTVIIEKAEQKKP